MAAKMGFRSKLIAKSFDPSYNKRRAQQLLREVVVSIIIVVAVVVPYIPYSQYLSPLHFLEAAVPCSDNK